MSQRREHRLRNLEKQYGAIAEQVASQDKAIEVIQADLFWLQRRVYGKKLALQNVPWYKRLFWRPRK